MGLSSVIKALVLWAALIAAAITSAYFEIRLDADGDGAIGEEDAEDDHFEASASLDDFGEPVSVKWEELSVQRLLLGSGRTITTVRPFSGARS